MSPEQWEIIRKNHEALKAREAALMRLLDRAAAEIPATSALHADIRAALGLSATPSTRKAA